MGIERKSNARNVGKYPVEVNLLINDFTKTHEKPGRKHNLITEMVKFDLEDAKRDEHLVNGGYTIKNYFE
jgi:hypothetical protein